LDHGEATQDRGLETLGPDARDGDGAHLDPSSLRPVIDVRSVTRAVGWSGLGQIASQTVWFGSLVVLGALLAPSAFGTVAAGMVIVYLTGLLMGSGTGGAIIAGKGLTRSQLRGALLYNVGAGIVLSLALALLAGPIVHAFARGGDPAVLRVLALGIFLNAFSLVPQALLQKQMKFKRQAAVKTAAATVGGTAAIAAGFAGAGVWALVLRILVSNACTSALAWIAVRKLLPPAGKRETAYAALRGLRRHGARWFLLLAAADAIASTVDNLIVGHFTGSAQLGLYALAFTLAFAPLTQFSWQVGAVLFSVTAATETVEAVARRTLRALRITALMLLPFVTPALVLAPVVLPRVLGEKWDGMVEPFQFLLVAGIIYALTNVIGEALCGSGNVGPRSRIHAAWCAATIGGVFLLARVDGIRGAALAHFLVSLPLAIAYLALAGRRLGSGVIAAWHALRDILILVAVQVACTIALIEGLEAAGISHDVAHVTGALGGLLVLVSLLLFWVSTPLREANAILAGALHPAK
jgi:O-antigen/teichoic acid export membrane protein